MSLIRIQESYITLSNIQECVEVYKSIRAGKLFDKELHLEAEKKLESFDILLISYFILFKKRIPDLSVYLYCPLNSISDGKDKVAHQLNQFGIYAYILTGQSIFKVEFKKEDEKRGNNVLSFNLQNNSSYTSDEFVYSEDFFPILYINEDTKRFNLLFNDSLEEVCREHGRNIDVLEEEIVWDRNSEQLKKNYHKWMQYISSPKDRVMSLINLACMAFVHALNAAKIASFYFKEGYNISAFNKEQRIQAGALRNEVAYQYYKEILPVFKELKTCSLAHQFFFSIVISTEMLRFEKQGNNILSQETKNVYINKIQSLWLFTKDLVTGIKELAKNIKEHAQPPVGAISVRLFSRIKWMQIKDLDAEGENVYQNYRDYLRDQQIDADCQIFDINVIDIGESGVIPTLMKDSQEILKEVPDEDIHTRKFLGEDIDNLCSGKISLKNLLDTSGMQLNQQSKRSIAHIGLLAFSELVVRNNGLVVASSYKKSGSVERDDCYLPDFGSNYSYPVELGTIYNISLPVNPGMAYDSYIPHKSVIPAEISAQDIKGIEEMFNYKLVNISDISAEETCRTSLKYIIQIKPAAVILEDREAERKLWHEIEQGIKKLQQKDNRYILCLNLEEVKCDGSQLFRLLGRLELIYPGLPLILLNIENENYQKLLKINERFYSLNRHLPYWNKKFSILIYSYIQVGKDYFYFSDILWGKTKKEFVTLNWMVSHSAMNSTMLANMNELKKDIIPELKIVPNEDLFFYNRNRLLPFELILKRDTDTTLFELNTSVLLKNELKS